MPVSKLRVIWMSIGAMVLVAIAVGVVALSGGGSGSQHVAGAPAVVASGSAGNPPAPARQTVTKVTTTHPQTGAPQPEAATGPPPGTPQANGGDADPDNNGGPDDSDGAI